MANYLICDNCQHKNTVNSERIVFCKSCDKKLANNYLDWKKSKFDSSFESYIAKETTKNGEAIVDANTIYKEKESVFKRTSSFISSNTIPEFKIFLGTTVILFALFFVLTSTFFNSDNSSKAENSSYLTEVRWGSYPITQTLSLSLPFELKESASVIPCYMQNYISNNRSQRSESSNSFSVTIEKMNFDPFYTIQNSDFVSINDAWMESPGVDILKQEGLHTIIKGYKTYVEHGSYLKDGNEYLYENYTLRKGDEGIKIILSYLKNDQLLCQYADIVTQSLLKNKAII
ncbi:MAG: hypothetical protein V4677_09375 [Bacteroidota bacterium]